MNIHQHQNNVLKNALKLINLALLREKIVNLNVMVILHILLTIKQMKLKYVMIVVIFIK